MKPIKLIKHINKVGLKQFRKEFKEGKNEVEADPTVNLKMQLIGYIGIILFSLISAGIFFWVKMWYVGGIFIFNTLIQFASFRNTRSQYKMIKEMANLSQEHD